MKDERKLNVRLTWRPLRLVVLVLLAPASMHPAYGRDEVYDSLMYVDPNIPTASIVKVFPPRLTSLWLMAMERPENDLKRQAAEAIGLARLRGMPGLETTVEALLRTLDQPEQNASVRLAVAQTLITLDARETAPQLFARAQADGIGMRDLVEPALARWDYAPARAIWLERLNRPKLPGRGWLLAINGLRIVNDLKAANRLRELALSPSTDSISRLAAAQALAVLETKGLEADAERLLGATSEPASLAQLIAASILRNHRSEKSAKILGRLAVDAEPAAAVVALDALLDDDPRQITPLLTRVFANRDAVVRTRGIEAFRRHPTADQIASMANLLDDHHMLVRTSARKALAEVAKKPDHAEAIRAQAVRVLAGTKWRALEQATILLAVLDHKAAAPRLIELLQFDRPEVFVAAAWGLRKLAVRATLPGQLHAIETRLEGSRKALPDHLHAMIDQELVQLAQSVGSAKYAPAAPVLARFVPKSTATGAESRSAAIWGLGYLHEKSPPADLVTALIDRLTDESFPMPENPLVRRMCAVALGRMKAKEAEDSLRRYYTGQLEIEPFSNTCGWALTRITGEKMPTSGTFKVVQVGWFLEPID